MQSVKGGVNLERKTSNASLGRRIREDLDLLQKIGRKELEEPERKRILSNNFDTEYKYHFCYLWPISSIIFVTEFIFCCPMLLIFYRNNQSASLSNNNHTIL